MGGQTGTQQTQQQSTTSLPPWISDAAQQNYADAQNVAERPLQQYQGQMVAGTSPQMQQAWNTAATTTNAGMPQFNAATAGFAGALGQTPMSVSAGDPTMQVSSPGNANQITAAQLNGSDLSGYMNPYTQSVIDKTMPIYQQQLGQQQSALGGTATQAGAFGGSRFGVAQGVLGAQGAQGMAQMASQLNQSNYAQAQAAAQGDVAARNAIATTNQGSQQTDLARQMQASLANQSANAADLNRSLTAQTSNQAAQQAKINSDIAASQGLSTTGQNLAQQANNAFTIQNTAGAEQMSQQQNEINADMTKFNQAWNYPTTQLGILQSGLSQTPYGQSTTGQTNTQTYTPTDWAALAAAGIGAAGNIFKPPPSDRRLKKNLKLAGPSAVDPDIPVYDYNWKGEAPGAPKTRGPMAQDIRKKYPGAVGKHPAGHLVVHPLALGVLSHVGPSGTIGALGSKHPPVVKHSGVDHRRYSRPPQLRGALG